MYRDLQHIRHFLAEIHFSAFTARSRFAAFSRSRFACVLQCRPATGNSRQQAKPGEAPLPACPARPVQDSKQLLTKALPLGKPQNIALQVRHPFHLFPFFPKNRFVEFCWPKVFPADSAPFVRHCENADIILADSKKQMGTLILSVVAELPL